MTLLNFNQDQLAALNDIIVDNFDEVLDLLGVKLYNRGRYMIGPCPVHGGDNPTSLNFYTDGHTQRGNWVCNSHHCERKYVPTAIGFVRGVLNNQKSTSFSETLGWVVDNLGVDVTTLKRDAAKTERTDFLSTAKILNNRKVVKTSLTPSIVKKNFRFQPLT